MCSQSDQPAAALAATNSIHEQMARMMAPANAKTGAAAMSDSIHVAMPATKSVAEAFASVHAQKSLYASAVEAMTASKSIAEAFASVHTQKSLYASAVEAMTASRSIYTSAVEAMTTSKSMADTFASVHTRKSIYASAVEAMTASKSIAETFTFRHIPMTPFTSGFEVATVSESVAEESASPRGPEPPLAARATTVIPCVLCEEPVEVQVVAHSEILPVCAHCLLHSVRRAAYLVRRNRFHVFDGEREGDGVSRGQLVLVRFWPTQ